MLAKNLRILRMKDDRLNRDLLQAQKNLSSATDRYKVSRKDETIKKNGSNWIAKWKCLPAELMAPYQDSKLGLNSTMLSLYNNSLTILVKISLNPKKGRSKVCVS